MKTKLLATLLALAALAGCRSQMAYVPVERVTVEYRDAYRLDSINYRDTVHIYSHGDTVFNEVIKWRERFVRDTVSYVRTDSVPVFVEVEKPAGAARLTWWQNLRMRAGDIALMLIAALAAWAIIKKKLKPF